jgi:hypothetical protein
MVPVKSWRKDAGKPLGEAAEVAVGDEGCELLAGLA